MSKIEYHCTANGDSEDCWLDENRRDLCWIENQPERKEDCKYWEIKGELDHETRSNNSN